MIVFYIFTIFFMLSILGPTLSLYIHRWTDFNFFKISNFERNWMILILSCIVIAIIDALIGVYFHVQDMYGDGDKLLFVISGLNLVIASKFYIWKEKFKDGIILVQNYSNIYETVTKGIDRSRWYDHYFWVIDSLASGNFSFGDDIVLPVIIIERCQVTRLHSGMLFDERVTKIRKHPYFRQFRRQLKDLTASEILERVDKFNRDNCREIYHSAETTPKDNSNES